MEFVRYFGNGRAEAGLLIALVSCVVHRGDGELTLSSATKNMPNMSENTTAARRAPCGYSSAARAFASWLATCLSPRSELDTRVHERRGWSSAIACCSESMVCLSIVDQVCKTVI